MTPELLDPDNITAFDALLLVVIGLSALTAFRRGFVTSVLSFASWFIAIMVTLFAYPFISEMARSIIDPDPLADFIGLIGGFFVILALLKLLANLIGDQIRNSAIGFLDRSLGALFGLILGVIVVSFVYMLYSSLVPEKRQPDWIQEATYQPLVSYGAEMLAEVVPEIWERMKEDPDVDDILDNMRDNMPSTGEIIDGVEKGYKDLERKEFDKKLEDLMNGDKEDDETET